MLFWTKKFRIENKQVFRKLTPVIIHEVISTIKNPKHLTQCLGNQKTPIWYVGPEAKDELKLVDNKCTRYTSQRKTEQTKVRVFVTCLYQFFQQSCVDPKVTNNKNNLIIFCY